MDESIREIEGEWGGERMKYEGMVRWMNGGGSRKNEMIEDWRKDDSGTGKQKRKFQRLCILLYVVQEYFKAREVKV